jgi:hypothetical protein
MPTAQTIIRAYDWDNITKRPLEPILSARRTIYAESHSSMNSRRSSTAIGDTPVFVICRDRLTPLKSLLAWLQQAGLDEVYLLDNDSRFGPLLDFYSESGYDVIHLRRNVGHLCLFTEHALRARIGDRPFVYTDPDVVPVEQCPLDAIDRFAYLLEKYSHIAKAGFGLRIDDLPDHYRHRRAVLEWEQQFWTREIEPGVFAAPIDTTFALYRVGTDAFRFDAVRTGWPYIARHLTWYLDDAALSEEDLFYQRRVETDTSESPSTSHWSLSELPQSLAKAISARSES